MFPTIQVTTMLIDIHVYADSLLGYHLGYLSIRLSGWKRHKQEHLDMWS